MRKRIFTNSTILIFFAMFQYIVYGSLPVISANLPSENDDFDINKTERLFYNFLGEDISKADSIANFLIEEKVGSDRYNIGIGYYYKGEIAYQEAAWSDAATFYQKSIEFLQNFDEERTAKAYNNLGCVYLYLSLYNKALEALTVSLEYELTTGGPVGIAQSYQNIALAYDRLRNVEKAIENNLIACDYLTDTEYEEELAGVYNNLATLFSDDKQFQEAENYYVKALNIYSNNGIIEQKAKVLCNYGNLKIKQGRYDEGGEILLEALDLFRENNNAFGEVVVYEMLADMYAFKNEYEPALQHAEIAYQKAQETDSYYLKLSTLYSLYLFYRKTENWKEALERFEIYTNIKDTLLAFDLSAKDDVMQIEFKHSILETEHLNRYAAEVKIKFQKMILIFILILSFVNLIAILYARKLKGELKFIKTEQKLIKKKTHFSLQSFLPKQNMETEKIMEYLPVLTDILEKTIDSTENIFVTIKSEIDYICSFIALCKNLYNKEIKLRFETNISDTKISSIIVPIMLFKPSIDHLLFCPVNENKELFFNVAFMVNNEKLEVTIEDNASQPFYKKYDPDGKILDSEIMLIKKRVKQMTKPGRNFIFKGISFEGETARFSYIFPLVYC